MAKRLVFAESSPTGDRVILDFIRASAKDAETHLYYRSVNLVFICVVVGGDDPNARFVVTAYFTKRPKKGQLLWTK